MSCWKLILWGAGIDYNSRLNMMNVWENTQKIRIEGVIASNFSDNIKSIDGRPVLDKSNLNGIDYDYLIVMSIKYEKEIINDAVESGVERNRIIPCRVMDIPYFDWDTYLRIRESRVSIISNNCFGGILYNTLGMECLSPFKNLSIEAKDLIQMYADLKKYMECELVFKEWRVDPHSGRNCPVMNCKDIEIFFNHSNTCEEAISDWERRKEKINYDNLMLVIYLESRELLYDFYRINTKKKICFIPREIEEEHDNEKSVYALTLYPGQKEFWQAVNSNANMYKGGITYSLLSLFEDEIRYRVQYK